MHYFEEPAGNNPKYPCGICRETVGKTHRFITCNLCNYKVHIIYYILYIIYYIKIILNVMKRMRNLMK